jgi:hypothetical protein
MQSRLDQPGASGRDVLADNDRLRAGFSSLETDSRHLGSSDAGVGLQLARLSFAWLDRASVRFRSDAAVVRALMGTYAFLGDFYRREPLVYEPNVWAGYSGASRLARALVRENSGGKELERSLEQFALDLAALRYVYVIGDSEGSGMRARHAARREPFVDVSPQGVEFTPVPLPQLDEQALSQEQRAEWLDVRARFVTVAARVNEARRLMAGLSERLRPRNMVINLANAATAVTMQGFVDDAAQLIKERQFALASNALVRADYERMRLKDITGQ